MREARARSNALSDALLNWYDAHARDLPWRVGPAARRAGARPDPYAVWLSEVMLQQTGVAVVKGYFRRFMTLWPDVHALAAAAQDAVLGEWAGLGYYARARNLIACARTVSGELGGVFPDTEAGLRALPGIGPYTAGAIAAIAFDRPATVVDGNVERVMARMFAETETLPGVKPALRAHAARLTPEERPGDYAQGVMDLGATICTPRSPACASCPWRGACRGRAMADSLPRRAAKVVKPTRRGTLWIARRSDGAWLVETRPRKGLLGGMLGWPGTGWDGCEAGPPLEAKWRDLGAELRHTFTHFHLRLDIQFAEAGAGATPLRGVFLPARDFRAAQMPSLMQKAHDLARDAFK